MPLIQDSALLRPGRLDRQVFVGPPDREGREEILRIRTQKMSVEPDLDVSAIAHMVSEVLSQLILVTNSFGSDGRILWSGIVSPLPRSSHAHNARELRGSFRMLLLITVRIILMVV